MQEERQCLKPCSCVFFSTCLRFLSYLSPDVFAAVFPTSLNFCPLVSQLGPVGFELGFQFSPSSSECVPNLSLKTGAQTWRRMKSGESFCQIGITPVGLKSWIVVAFRTIISSCSTDLFQPHVSNHLENLSFSDFDQRQHWAC